ncbi:MAG: CsbD family protein [Desulfuromonadales bacterium]|nr:CsbD family protein [Desulfuromonadales bacterium]
MKSGIRDQAEGRLHAMKGKVKEVAGRLTDNPRLMADGRAETIAGKLQTKIGQIKLVMGR